MGQQAFAVVAAGPRRPDRGGPVGPQPGEQEAGLDLRGRDRRVPRDAAQPAPSDDQRRQPAVVAPVDAGAHGPQGLGDPAHGPPPQRHVTRQHRDPVDPGHDTREQPHAGPGVATVEDVVGLAQRPGDGAGEVAVVVGVEVDGGAQCRQARRGGAGIARRGDPRDDDRRADLRPEQQGPVRQGLVPRDDDLPGQRAGVDADDVGEAHSGRSVRSWRASWR